MRKKASQLYYEHIGEDFDAFMSEYDVEARIKLIKQLIIKFQLNGTILEVGCGTGRISKMLTEHTDHLTVSDISEKLCESVAKKLNTAFIASDACKLSIEDAQFDNLVSSECIEHTHNPTKALEEMVRVLKPGGKLIITSPNKVWYPALVIAEFLRIRKYSGIENWLFPRTAARVLTLNSMNVDVTTGCHLLPWQIPGFKTILPFFDRFGEYLYPIMINYAICATKSNNVTIK